MVCYKCCLLITPTCHSPPVQDSGDVCSLIKLCNDSAMTSTSGALRSKPRPLVVPKQDVCDICKLVVTFVKPYVDSNSTKVRVT